MIFKANFDYEDELFLKNNNSKIVDTLEHLFFFCMNEADTLSSQRDYDEDYLKFIKDAIGFVPNITKKTKEVNWWGELKQIELEKKLNSKVTSYKISKELNYSQDEKIITKLEDLEEYLAVNGEMFLRHPNERSGRLSFQIKNIKDLKYNIAKIEKVFKRGDGFLVDKYRVNRKWDLGTTYKQVEDHFEIDFQIKNLNDKKGAFRGAVLLEKGIASKELNEIALAYFKEGARGSVQVDSFSYDDKIKWLCEVNYRKTMGHVVNKLKRLCLPGQSIAILLTPSSWIRNFNTHTQLQNCLEDIEGVYPLSPVQNSLQCWLISSETRDDLLELAIKWWKKVAKNAAQFPSIYTDLLPEQYCKVLERSI